MKPKANRDYKRGELVTMGDGSIGTVMIVDETTAWVLVSSMGTLAIDLAEFPNQPTDFDTFKDAYKPLVVSSGILYAENDEG